MLIKTDSQNYTNIADAIREVTGSTKQYKPEEMELALASYVPKCAVSYDTIDSDGYVLTATVHGDIIMGLGGHKKLKSANIPDTATTVASYAFNNCGLTNINLPSGLSVIEDYGFYSSNFIDIVLPNGVTTIGEWAFGDAELTNITLPNSIVEIKDWAFYNTKLESIIFPENITEVSNCLFHSCKNLTMNSLPEHITKIGGSAFNDCVSITEFTFHDKISHISYSFQNCTGLTTVTFKGTPVKISSGDIAAFKNCPNLTTINVPWSEGEVAGAPWGATNAIVNYNYTDE